MAETFDTADAAIDSLAGDETFDEAEYPLRDFSSKEIDVYLATRLRAIEEGGGGEGGGGWPVRELIFATTKPKANNNFDTLSAGTSDVPPMGVVTSDNTDGSWIEWYVALMDGTYSLAVKGFDWSGGGILVFSLNGTNIDGSPYNASGNSYDGYSAGGSGDILLPRSVADDITIPTSAVYVLRATVTGKNASASGFATNLAVVALDRIAA